MKLLVAGNLANTGFYLASTLRKNSINADLLMENNPKRSSDPKSTIEFEGNKYPEWIKFWDWKKNWKFEIIKTMRKYDIISAATELPMLALFSLKPYVAIATGSDMNFLSQTNSLRGILLRCAYKRAKIVVYVCPSSYLRTKQLKLKNSVFLPNYRDFTGFESTLAKKAKNKFIIFHPSLQDWFIKKNFIFFEAAAKICKKYDNVSIICVNHGIDAEKSKKMVKESNLEEKCEFLPSTLDQNELKKYYQMCDIVVDQFGFTGAFGVIALETLYQGIPLIGYIKKDIFKDLYGEIPPILGGETVEEVYDAIEKLIIDKEFFDDIGNKSKLWMKKYHSEEIIMGKYMDLYKMVYEKRDSKDIINHLKFNQS